jgi:hypothetical protein
MINGIGHIVPRREVTFRDFASLAKRRGWTPEFLAEKFKGKIEGPSEFFHRCLEGKPDWNVVVPFESILEFYLLELGPLIEKGPRLPKGGPKNPYRTRVFLSPFRGCK